jgi:hypothetical protein
MRKLSEVEARAARLIAERMTLAIRQELRPGNFDRVTGPPMLMLES